MKAVPLKELCQVKHGGTPSKGNPAYWTGAIPWVSPKDMKSSVLEDATDHISEEAVANSATSVVPQGSILVVARSGILAHSIPVARAGRPLAFNQDIKAILPKPEKVDPEYLYWFIRGSERALLTQGVKKGATVHSLQSGVIENLMVPLLPFSEQRRIVDLLSRAEGIVRLRREAQKKAAEIIPALFLDMFGDPATNPKGWPVVPLSDVVEFRSGGTPSKAREDFWTGDLPWVSPKDMKTAILSSATDHVSRTVLTETNLKLIPSGAVLIVVRGMILVHTVPVGLAAIPLTINQDMKALIPRIELEALYLLWTLKVLHEHLLSMVSTAAHGTKKLDTDRLESLLLPLPPLEKQRAFARRIESVLSVLALQTTALGAAERTFQALLAHAFSSDPIAGEIASEEAAVA